MNVTSAQPAAEPGNAILRYLAGFVAAFGLATMIAAAAQAAGQSAQVAPDRTVQLRPTGVAPGRYIVVFRDSVARSRVRANANALARANGFALRHVYSTALKGFAAELPARALAALRRNPQVAYIEADQWVQAFAQTTPTGVRRIFADQNPNITIDGTDDLRIDVDVAVLDTGIDHTHPDLDVVARTDCTSGRFTASCTDGSGADGDGHGTHVAGTIAAIDNDLGVVGVAPGARLWAVKVLDNNGSGLISWIVAGIDYVTANAAQIEIANMSLGCECSSAALDEAIANSVAAGVTYAVAANNQNKDTATFSPANHPDVITVSALADFDGAPGGAGAATCRLDQDDTLADFSNWGAAVEIAAPGACILSTWTGGGYAISSGTSMASPHVAGAAALLAASGLVDPTQIRQALVDSGNSGWVDDSGDGIKEPLLDVGDATLFVPITLPGDGGPPPADAPPSVAWVSPAAGATVADTVAIEIAAADAEDAAGTLTVQWQVDGGDWQVASYNAGSGNYEADWDTTMAPDGPHSLTARATDSADNVTTATISLEVGNDPAPAVVSVSTIDYATEGGKKGDRNLRITVTLADEASAPVAGANVSIELFRNGTPAATGSGTTGSGGTVSFLLRKARRGCYQTVVTAVSAAGWDGLTPANQFCK